jgi:hypothetical protein
MSIWIGAKKKICPHVNSNCGAIGHSQLIVQNETLKGQLQMREAQLRKMERWMELLGQDSTMAKNVPAQLLDDLTPQQQAKAYINNQWLWLHCSERLLGKMERTAFEDALNKT